MKSPILFLWFFGLVVFSAAESRIEFQSGGKFEDGLNHSAELKTLKNIKEINHPWKPTQPLPTTLAEAGLGEDASLVVSMIYLDGGSRVFALKDGAGRYLLFCTTKPQMQTEYDKGSAFEEKFYVGAAHWADAGGAVVPRGSKAEEFLLKVARGKIVEAVP
ncbi:MAG: hypothetical protein QM715_05050 [Nibricoccus sp.]